MRVLALVILGWVVFSPGSRAAAATSSSPYELAFRNRGAVVRTLPLEELQKAVPARNIVVQEPHEGRDVEYVGLPAREVFQVVYGKEWEKAEEVLFTCVDGYQPSIPVAKFLRHTPYLVFKRSDGDFQVTNQLQNAERVPLGPFYLVWENRKDLLVKVDGASIWPYQVNRIDLIRFADKFPRMAPPHGSSRQVRDGFLAFRTHCMSCHTINGDGGAKAVELNYPVSVTETFQEKWLRRWIDDPTSVRFNTTMPRLNAELPQREKVLDDILAYLRAMSRTKKAPAALRQ